MSEQYNGLYVIVGIGLAMMINSVYIRRTEKKRTDELLSGVTERPVYNKNMENRHSIGGSKKTKKQIKR
uniref:Uncharacterized protein n=1 Tax=viral metagenome TaxID=1070528 RepID=A0A6C0B8M4_9ZZZZ